MGYLFSWIYMCLLTVVFVPLFSVSPIRSYPTTLTNSIQWWLPSPAPNSTSEKSLQTVSCWLKKFNMVLLPLTAGLCLAQHIYYTIHTFIYVDSRELGSRTLPKNTKKNWLTRLMLLLGIAFSTTFGYYAFGILERMQLARVKPLEYYIIVLPILVNMGVLIGTAFQFKMEKRIARKEAQKALAAKLEEGSSDEKAALIEA